MAMDSAEWADRLGTVWAEQWRRTDRSFAGLTPSLLAAVDAVAPAGAGAALDIGCGAGETGIALARRHPALAVTGVDIAPSLVATAQERGRGIANLRFVVADAAGPLGLAPQDLLLSRHGVMFFDDPAAAFASLHAQAAPAAPLVFSCFRTGAENPWAGALVAALGLSPPPPPAGYAPGPFAFADPAFVRALLQSAGWAQATVVPVDFPYLVGEGAEPVADAVETFALIGPVAAAIAAAPVEARAGLRATLADILSGHRDGDRVALPAAAWIWTARA